MMNSLGIKGLLAASIAMTFAVSAFAVGVTPVASASPTLVAKFNASALRSEGTYDRFIVRYVDGSTEKTSQAAALQNVKAAVSRAGAMRASLSSSAPSVSYGRKLATGSDLVTTSRKLTQDEAAAFMQSIAADPAVAHVAPDVLRHAIGDIKAPANLSPTAFTPNDPYYAAYQTDYLPGDGTLTPTGKVANYGGVNAKGAWDLADGTGVIIAVIDTGIVKHADVNTSLGDAGYDFIIDKFVSGRTADGRVSGGWDLGDWTTGNTYKATNGGCVDANNPAEASSWHGTHVSSASGAELTNNGIGMAGIAYNARVLPIRALGHCGGYDSDINDAIVWAAGGHVDGVPDNQNPAQVINMSLGGDGTCAADDDAALAIAKANALGTTVVVAAGNDGESASLSSPSSCPGVITVAATGYTSKLTFYSNYNSPGESVVALGAFGGGVYPNDATSGTAQQNPEGFAWQAINTGTTTPKASPGGDTYGGMAGTSQATPHVTAAVALMQSARISAGLPLLKPAEVLSILKSTARVPNVTPDAAKTFGAGILDAGAAVAAAVAYVPDNGGGDGGNQDTTIPLTNGVVLANQSGAAGSSTVYTLNVPAGALALTLRTLGGTGNVSIYVKAGSAASATDYDFKSAVGTGTAKSVAISRPVAATYYVTVVGDAAYSGVSVSANFVAPK
ncbi:S8 family serine peptidase [Rhodanobacter sp. C01]|uniref:S8 family serine peptidase n=1 Tax=Rhodanobacter sp. C01 TaxID=1945856 RepID=UPI0009862180|nr:S8 family serine peptidase [Rhodanobacter sp. C01]OOG49582.1 protease [Rhodanobacter sp. C01]